MDEYDGRQFVAGDLHRRRSVIVRTTPEGQRIGQPVRIDNDPFELAEQIAVWGEARRWYWKPPMPGTGDMLAEAGAVVHLAHPLGVKGFAYRQVKYGSWTTPSVILTRVGCGHGSGLCG